MNISLLGKLIWHNLIGSDKPWVQVLSQKYLQGKSIFQCTRRHRESCTWRSILKALDFLREGFHYQLYSGDSSFWFSDWTGSGLLCHKVPFVHLADTQMRVHEVWDGQQWALDRLRSFLTADFIGILRDQDGLRNSQLPDSWSWDKDHPGAYSVGKAYNWLLHHHRSLQPLDQIWRSVWALQLPEKLCFFIWQCLHDALPTN
ncbi:Reverse transcriptase zinc-binding domain [Sesbania bispinosa]|nr:Reverse transcriptase zinc-binding domain [Sesbania bispinosa]